MSTRSRPTKGKPHDAGPERLRPSSLPNLLAAGNATRRSPEEEGLTPETSQLPNHKYTKTSFGLWSLDQQGRRDPEKLRHNYDGEHPRIPRPPRRGGQAMGHDGIITTCARLAATEISRRQVVRHWDEMAGAWPRGAAVNYCLLSRQCDISNHSRRSRLNEHDL